VLRQRACADTEAQARSKSQRLAVFFFINNGILWCAPPYGNTSSETLTKPKHHGPSTGQPNADHGPEQTSTALGLHRRRRRPTSTRPEYIGHKPKTKLRAGITSMLSDNHHSEKTVLRYLERCYEKPMLNPYLRPFHKVVPRCGQGDGKPSFRLYRFSTRGLSKPLYDPFPLFPLLWRPANL